MTPSQPELELSIVMPCLDEADTIADCVLRALQALDRAGIPGEVVVADNGSSDGSRELAERAGARVVSVEERGYGSALMGGIAAARGRYVVMGDADLSYDFAEAPRILDKLREGHDLVQGCRLPNGGGTVRPGAMPWSHRWIGNPLFSFLARLWFGTPIHDVYCGLRGFRRDFWLRLEQRCTGMEFATEMIIRASMQGARIGEVPITLTPDGRRAHAPHLRTVRDGWRTLRFFLLYSPRWLFVAPGLGLLLAGLLGYGLALPGASIGRATLDAHTLVFATLFLLCGYQALVFGACAKTFAIGEGLLPPDPPTSHLFSFFTLERGLAAGTLMLLAALVLLFRAIWEWWRVDFGGLDYAHTMRLVVPGATLGAIGFETLLASFFLSLLHLRRR